MKSCAIAILFLALVMPASHAQDCPIEWTREEYIEKELLHDGLPPTVEDSLRSYIDSDISRVISRLEGVQENLFYQFGDLLWAFYWPSVSPADSLLLAEACSSTHAVAQEMVDTLQTLSPPISNDESHNVCSLYCQVREKDSLWIAAVQDIRTAHAASWYSAVIDTFRPIEYHPMDFSTVLLMSSYERAEYMPLEILLWEVDHMASLGVDILRIDMHYDWEYYPIESVREKMDSVIARVRTLGCELCIDLRGLKGWNWDSPVSFETWKSFRIAQLHDVISRYDPEYLILVPESMWWTQDQITDTVSANEWAEEIEFLADSAKALAPDVKTMVTLCAGYHECGPLHELLQGVDNLDIIGYDHYDLVCLILGLDSLIKYNVAGKELWVGETSDGLYGQYYDWYADSFIVGTVYYARSKLLGGYNYFFSSHFFTGIGDTTPAYCTYKALIEEVGIEESNDQRSAGNWRLSIHPNPFTRSTVISYSSLVGARCVVPKDLDSDLELSIVDCRLSTVAIHDLSGRVVRSFQISKSPDLQIIRLSWDGRNDAGKVVRSGVYFVKLTVGNEFSKTKKLLLLR
jgi:hypothetical protein